MAAPDGAAVEATVVLAQESGAPAGVKQIVWRLLTNRLVASLETAAELSDWYRRRWEFEIFLMC